jgi:uracil-DNA glycosylase
VHRPATSPLPAERDACAPWLSAEWRFLQPTVRVVVVLGGYGWSALWPTLREAGERVPAPVPKFGHGVEVELASGLTVLGCFHVSQQNTFTGRLTEPDAGRRLRAGPLARRALSGANDRGAARGATTARGSTRTRPRTGLVRFTRASA